jgi:hypothetical protein
MNNHRRKDIEAIRAKLTALSIDLGNLKDEEEISHGNLSERNQAGQVGKKMQQAMTALDDAIRCVDEADSYLGIAIK